MYRSILRWGIRSLPSTVLSHVGSFYTIIFQMVVECAVVNIGQNESFCPVKVGWKSQAGEKPIAGRLEKAYFSIFR